MLAGVEDCLVFGDRGDDVITFFPVHPGDAFDRQVIGLRRTTRNDDFPGVRTDQRRDLFPGVFDGLFRFPAELVIPACRIPELVGEEGHHRVEHSRIQRGGRVIVHVNRQLNHGFLSIAPNWSPVRKSRCRLTPSRLWL